MALHDHDPLGIDALHDSGAHLGAIRCPRCDEPLAPVGSVTETGRSFCRMCGWPAEAVPRDPRPAITPAGEDGDMFVMDPMAESAWLTVGRVAPRITVSDEGSVEVTAYQSGREMDDELASFYVSWQELQEGHP